MVAVLGGEEAPGHAGVVLGAPAAATAGAGALSKNRRAQSAGLAQRNPFYTSSSPHFTPNTRNFGNSCARVKSSLEKLLSELSGTESTKEDFLWIQIADWVCIIS